MNRLSERDSPLSSRPSQSASRKTSGLDFKEKADASNGRLTKDDRQVLAENVSAFANSAGGLLVLGVAARKDADGVDAAAAVRPIKELARFQTEVTHAVGELLLPRHDGILVRPIPMSDDPDTGCLAIWVERSERRPHQSRGMNSAFIGILDKPKAY